MWGADADLSYKCVLAGRSLAGLFAGLAELFAGLAGLFAGGSLGFYQ